MVFDFKSWLGQDSEKRKPKKQKTKKKARIVKLIISKEEVAELIVLEERVDKKLADSNAYLKIFQLLIVRNL